MNCPHPENPSNEFDDETHRSLCQDCRKKAFARINTQELIDTKKVARETRRKMFIHFRENMPRLQNIELVMSEALKNDSLEDTDTKSTRLLHDVIAFVIISIHGFEINEVLNERAGRS